MTKRQKEYLINWAKLCKDVYERSGNILPSRKIETENGGFSLTPNLAIDIAKDEVDEWENFLQELINRGIIKETKPFKEYKFTSMKWVEEILLW